MYDVFKCLHEIEDEIRNLEEETELLLKEAETEIDRSLVRGRYAVTRKMRFLVQGIRRGENIQ